MKKKNDLKYLPIFSVLHNFRRVNFDDAKNPFDFSLKQMDVEYPYSCTMEEGMIMHSIIKKHQLKRGYEIATAFGISSLFIASAFKKTKGLLETIDCYIEEDKNDFIYSIEDIKKHTKKIKENIKNGIYPHGYEVAKANSEKMKVQNNVRYLIGVSPDDVVGKIQNKLDFVFIDGGHFGEQPTIDFNAVKDKIGEKCALFFHDNNGNPSTAAAIQEAEEYFGIKAIDLNTHWHLTLLPIGIDLEHNKKSKSFLYKLFHLYWLRGKQ